jgi:hypothetical protein
VYAKREAGTRYKRADSDTQTARMGRDSTEHGTDGAKEGGGTVKDESTLFRKGKEKSRRRPRLQGKRFILLRERGKSPLLLVESRRAGHLKNTDDVPGIRVESK